MRTAADPDVSRIDKSRPYSVHHDFIEPFAASTRAALAGISADLRDQAHLVFTAHSVPVAMAEASGPGQIRGRYVAELTQAARLFPERGAGAPGPGPLPSRARAGRPPRPRRDPDRGHGLAARAAAAT